MEIRAKSGNFLETALDLCILGVFEDVPLPAEVAGLFEASDFQGRSKQQLLLYPNGKLQPRRLLLVGLGKRDKLNLENIRQTGAAAVKKAQELKVPAFTVGVQGEMPLDPRRVAQAFAEGI